VAPAKFEYFIARRYLRARRKQAVISLITGISIMGVAAGVMALVIALAINNGFRNTLQRTFLGATAHISVLEKEPGTGIVNWQDLAPKLRRLPHVTAASPTFYGEVFLRGTLQSRPAVLKGVETGPAVEVSGMLRQMKAGSAQRLNDKGHYPPIILGSALARETGMLIDSVMDVISPQGELTPYGLRPKYQKFRVVGIFESGFFEFDQAWAFTSLGAAQRLFSVGDVVNSIELRLDDIYAAPQVAREVERITGPKLAATTWMEQQAQIMRALRMERAVTAITIGLIELVAALNILITLVMMVMEKYKDIAVLMSMGARRQQIRNIFIFQGVLIGVVGTAIGLVVGHALAFLADRYHWVALDEQVYSLGFVPFEPRLLDSVWVAMAAILVSFLATIYPALNATRIAPAEVLRYE
jgi:lipoprotein-releasing system permease protein